MPIDVLMPALSPTMEKGTLLQWVKRVGDAVRVGDILLEVETDKATMDVEATAAGTLASILVAPGTVDVPVNQRIGVILGEAEAEEPAAAADAGGGIAAAKPAPAPSEGDWGNVAGLLTDRKQANGEHRLFASPIARRLIKEAGLDAAALTGSGPHGRILERDVKAAVAGSLVEKAPATAKAVAPVPTVLQPGRFDEVPHAGMRRTIARRLTEAKQTVPHFYLAADCRMDALLKLRADINAGTLRITVNDLLIKALAGALIAVPDANVSFTEETMIHHRNADISVAVAIEGGLVTPVVLAAETKSLSAISAEMKDFSARARERRLKPEEYQGGTAGLSNLGMFGVREFAAILNPPQATMFAIGAAERRMIVEKDDTPGVATMMTVTLSADHRAVDGATAARFLSAFKALVEAPMAMLV